MLKRRNVILLLLAAICILLLVQYVGMWLLGDLPSPDMKTSRAMAGVKGYILDYVWQHHSVPQSLGDLGRAMDRGCVDGWGRQIIYQHDGDNVTLTSYGKDGLPGGTGKDADIVQKFRAQ